MGLSSLSADGMKPDPEKVDTVRFMDPPTNVSEVCSFVSMAAFLSRFIPKFSSITAPLRHLTEKNAKWKWSEEEQSAFEFVQDNISEHTTLSYYDVGKDTKSLSLCRSVWFSCYACPVIFRWNLEANYICQLITY